MNGYLGWKPNEPRFDKPPFEIPDADNLGSYSGKPGTTTTLPIPQTLDFYTDEALLTALLAIASPNPQNRLGREVWDSILRQVEPGDGPYVKSFPGSLFTYFFASSWLDWRLLGTDAHPTMPVNWYLNNQGAIQKAFTNTAARVDSMCGTLESSNPSNPDKFCTYGVGPVGLTAAEGPDDKYRAYTDPAVALRSDPHMDDGTVAPYGAGSTILYTPTKAIQALRAYTRVPGVWHPRFGFADAFNMDPTLVLFDDVDRDAFIDPITVDQVTKRVTSPVLSVAQPWVNPARFAIDQGPLLLTIHNHLTQTANGPGYIQSLIMNDLDIRRALSTLYPPPCLHSGSIVRVTTIPGNSPSTLYLRTSALNPVFFSGITSDANLIRSALRALKKQTKVTIAGTVATCPAPTAGGNIGAIRSLIVNP